MVDQDAPHQLGGNAEEVSAILPGHPLLADQPHVGFVDERRGLKRVPRALIAHVGGGDPAQLVVHERRQLLESIAISAAPLLQKGRHLRLCRLHDRLGLHFAKRRKSRRLDHNIPPRTRALVGGPASGARARRRAWNRGGLRSAAPRPPPGPRAGWGGRRSRRGGLPALCLWGRPGGSAVLAARSGPGVVPPPGRLSAARLLGSTAARPQRDRATSLTRASARRHPRRVTKTPLEWTAPTTPPFPRRTDHELRPRDSRAPTRPSTSPRARPARPGGGAAGEGRLFSRYSRIRWYVTGRRRGGPFNILLQNDNASEQPPLVTDRHPHGNVGVRNLLRLRSRSGLLARGGGGGCQPTGRFVAGARHLRGVPEEATSRTKPRPPSRRPRSACRDFVTTWRANRRSRDGAGVDPRRPPSHFYTSSRSSLKRSRWRRGGLLRRRPDPESRAAIFFCRREPVCYVPPAHPPLGQTRLRRRRPPVGSPLERP